MRCRQWSAVPTAKLDVCDIKIVTAHPDKIKNARRLLTTVERTFLKATQKPFCKKVFCGAFFQKRSAVPTAKLGRSGIKIVTVYPDGVELIKVECTIFENSPKTFCKKSFWRYLFSKR